tara:strand:+ start:168 stop:656 length:489 start_codon:yes stop_codon:yes gene_type:complete
MFDNPAIAIGIGMFISLLLTETLGVTAGGVIVPGYIALNLHNPLAVVMTFLISLLVLGIIKFLSSQILIYGKRRLVLTILLGFWIGFLIREIGIDFFMLDIYYSWFSDYYQGSNEMIFIGHLIPGLIASWMDRQGAVVTVSTVLISGSVVNLILMSLDKIYV